MRTILTLAVLSTVAVIATSLAEPEKEKLTAQFSQKPKYKKLFRGKEYVFRCKYVLKTSLARIKKPILEGLLLVENKDKKRVLYRYHFDGIEHVTKASLAAREVESLAYTAGTSDAVSVRSRPFRKLIVWRVEVWQDGQLLCQHSSLTDRKLELLKIPIDWHTRKGGEF